MNLVLADTEEFRRVRRKPAKPAQAAPGSSVPAVIETEEKRTLGLTIVRGTHIVSLSVDGPPPADPSTRLGGSSAAGATTAPATLAAGPGITKPAGRGLPVGLTGPAVGVGGPGPAGFGGFPPPVGFPGGVPGFPGRGDPTGAPRKYIPLRLACYLLYENNILTRIFIAGFQPPQGFGGLPPGVPRKFQTPLSRRALVLTSRSRISASAWLPGSSWSRQRFSSGLQWAVTLRI